MCFVRVGMMGLKFECFRMMGLWLRVKLSLQFRTVIMHLDVS